MSTSTRDPAGTSVRRRPVSLQAIILQTALATLGANLALLYISPPVGAAQAAVASGILWMTALVWVLHCAEPGQPIPFLPAMYAALFMYFGLPVFLDAVTVRGVPVQAGPVLGASSVVLAGEAALLVAFYSPARRLFGAVPRLTMEFPLTRLAALLAIVSVASLPFTILRFYREVPASLNMAVVVLGRLPLMTVAGVFLLWLRRRAKPMHLAAALFSFTVYTALALATGTLAQVLFGVLPLVFLYFAERGRVPYKSIIIVLLVLAPFSATKHELRRLTWKTGATVVDRLEMAVTLAAMAAVGQRSTGIRDMGETAGARTSAIGTFAVVVRDTPSRVPYWRGETYRHLAWSFVPRLLVPDKPVKTHTFGHRYRFLDPRDHETSVNMPQIVEMYANFGTWGVVLGMALVGLYLRLLYQLLNHRLGGDGISIVAAMTFTDLMNLESDASLVLFGAPVTIIGTYVMLRGLAFIGRALGARRAGAAGAGSAPRNPNR